MEVIGVTSAENKIDSAIRFFNKRVVKNEHGRINLEVSNPTVHSSKSFKSLKCC